MSHEIIYSFLLSVVLVLILGYVGIPLLKKMHAQQSIREEGPKKHQAKAGTPTMGGIFILIGITIASLIFVPKGTALWICLLLMLGHGFLGFFDDFIKAVKKRNLGLSAKQKLLGQIILATIFCYFAKTELALSTEIWIPFFNVNFDLGFIYYPFVFLVLVGATNAVNLTDGLDGLASGTTAIAAITYVVVSLWASYTGLATFSAAIAGACIGFLYFNAHPAKVFMGDTGSLALGGALAAIAILTKTELLLAIIGGVFVMEAMSVIIQVTSFKTRGKRVFKMSPIHHHFELSGWKETKVVVVFYCLGILLSLLGLMALLAK